MKKLEQKGNNKEIAIWVNDHICPWWLTYLFDSPLRRLFHKPEKIFRAFVTEGMTVLDIGCGMGFFSIGLANLVGRKGCVIAADIQQKSLEALKGRAEKAGVSDRIRIHRCEPNELGVGLTVGFILAFWMVHEVPDKDMFFHQICSCLKPNGKIFIVEPKFHVSSSRFQEILVSAQKKGFRQCGSAWVRFSRAAMFERESFGSPIP